MREAGCVRGGGAIRRAGPHGADASLMRRPPADASLMRRPPCLLRCVRTQGAAGRVAGAADRGGGEQRVVRRLRRPQAPPQPPSRLVLLVAPTGAAPHAVPLRRDFGPSPD